MTRTDQTTEPDVTTFSNAIRLTGRQWVGVGLFTLAMVVFAPSLWKQVEKFDLEPDYRIPHELSNDYWLYDRYSRLAAAHYDTMVIGDSVIWGEYVTRQQTLAHYLNEQAGSERFANLGLDGAHPLALAGLVEHYARAVSGKKVVLFCNLLWLSSRRADLQDEDLPDFSHPRLVPQFVPRIPCYREEISSRLGVVVEQHVSFNSWTNHLQQAYYGRIDIPSWTLDHPYDNPLKPLTGGLPALDNSPRHLPQLDIRVLATSTAALGASPVGPSPFVPLAALMTGTAPQPWYKTGKTKHDYPGVELERSLQWHAFQQVVDVLQRRGNRVFVLVGPFNEHMLDDESLQAFRRVKSAIENWLTAKQVAHAAPPPLPSDLYGDASHPLSAGYAELAQQLFEDDSFKLWFLSQ